MPSRAHFTHPLGLAVIAGLVALALSLIASPGASAGTFYTGFAATEANTFNSASPAQRASWNARAASVGSRFIRLNVSWRAVAPQQRPANPADPGAYNLAPLDDIVTSVRQAGLEPILMAYSAPHWARRGTHPEWAKDRPDAWQPKPADFGAFGRALARRYDGTHGVPRVRYFQAWVEPNLSIYLAPQWRGGERIVSADRYRKMLNAFYAAVKGVRFDNRVVTAGTAPFGEEVGTGTRPGVGGKTRPLAFWREVFCLKKNLKRRSECRGKAKFDILAHHPINVRHEPSWTPRSNDDLVPANLGGLTKALRAAEKRKTLGTRGRHPLWAPEIWLETSPPDKNNGFSLRRHAAYLAETLYLIARAGGSMALNLQIQDTPIDNSREWNFNVQSGLWYAPNFRGGAKKRRSARVFRFPVWGDRVSREKVKVWGRAPESGKVRIQVKMGKGGFKTVATRRVRPFQTFEKKVRLEGKGKVRAVLGKQTALAAKVPKS